MGKFLTWLRYTARTLGGLYRKHLRIGSEPRQMATEAEAFATALDENPDLWCEIIQVLAAKPPFRPP